MATVVGNVFPVAEEWLGIGREAAPANAVAPTSTLAVEKIEPDEKITMLDDNSVRGMMANLFSVTTGTEYADVNFSGPVYLDTIGHVLLNLMGDYQVSGTAGTGTVTTAADSPAGSSTITTAATTTDYSAGQAFQTGEQGGQIVVLSADAASGATSLEIASTPLRMDVANGSTLTAVSAPYTHKFSLLNASPGQPPTHTLTYHQGISGDYGAVQYPYWCCSGCSFTMDAEKLFTHDTKGQAFIRQDVTAQPTNAFSDVPVYPNWRFSVGIGGPASGATLVNDVTSMSLDITRTLKNYFTSSGQQSPYVIARNALAVEGKFTEVAQSDQPMLELLNNTQPSIQLSATNGKTGADTLAIAFDMQVGAYETVKLNENDVFEYETSYRAVANPVNAGVSGGQAPLMITLVNAVPTY